MSWTEEHEKFLKILQKYSYVLYNKNHSSYIRYKNKLENYKIPIICITSLTGFLSLLTFGYIPDHYVKWCNLIIGFFNIMVSIISLIEHYRQIDISMKKYLKSYFDFKKLNDDILFLLRCNINERPNNGFDTIKEFYVDFRKAYENMPISTNLTHDFLNKDVEIKTIKAFIKENSIMNKNISDDSLFEISSQNEKINNI
jgi:hypothetical protein